MFRARSAVGIFDIYNAVFYDKMDASHLDFVLLLHRQRDNGVVRADVAANCAVVVAEPAGEIQVGLHESFHAVF